MVIDERPRIDPENKMPVEPHPAKQAATTSFREAGGECRLHLRPVAVQMPAQYGLRSPGEPGACARPGEGAVKPDQARFSSQALDQSGRAWAGTDFFGARFRGRWLER